MTFLNPYVLFGLIAASFPVLFHLFAQKRARRVEFSSIRFLQKLEKSSMRKVKLRQILLLILRTLLIICLVMAFSRPALHGYSGGFFGTSHANTTVVLLIDNSASMSRRNTNGTYFKQATDVALEIVNAVNDGDEVIVAPLASLERGKEYPPLHTLGDIHKAISNLHIADAPAHIEDGLRVASSAFAKSLNVNKEIYLISDAQARNYQNEQVDVLNDSLSHLKLFDERTKLYITDIGESDKNTGRNLSIDSLEPSTTIFEPGRPLQFDAYIRNTGDGAIENTIVSLFYDEERVAQRSLTGLAQNKTEKISIGAQPRKTGLLSVRAELEEDALPFDNKRYLALTLPATRHIGIFMTRESDMQFIKLALEQTLSENNELPYSVELHRLEELRMLPSLRSRLDAIIVGIGGEQVDGTDSKALKDFIASGKGTAFFALNGIQIQQFNSLISSTIGIPGIESKEGSAQVMDKYASFAQFDFAHPFFAGMFEEKSGSLIARGIESPKVFEYYHFSRGGIPLITLSSGVSFLSESTVGKGKVLLFSVPPTFAFSDFPRKAIFLPLIRRTAAYLSSVSTKDESELAQYYTDEPFDITLPEIGSEQSGLKLFLKSPDGSTDRVETITALGKLRIHIDNAHTAGIYIVYKDPEAHEPITAFAVNIRSDEADLTRATTAQADSLVTRLFAKPKESIARLDATNKNLTQKIKESRFGVEMWQTFLVIALLCAIAEMLIAREGKVVEP
jgi:hypothetical protein